MSNRKKPVEDVVENNDSSFDDRVIEVDFEDDYFDNYRFDDDGGSQQAVPAPSSPPAPVSPQIAAAENQARLARGETDLLPAEPDTEPAKSPDIQPFPASEGEYSG